ncbi:MAG: c-type cytochrome [Paracoccaceae bacterium]|jgi:mono/diheme cytochrome c family protein
MTINAWKKPAAIFAALSLLAGAAHADDAGKAEYINACAACHGESGVGDGPLAELMTVPMPNLTTLAQQNDGVFPMLDVIHIVDGRTGVRGHGYPMPVWGSRFKGEVVEEMGDYGAEMVVRGRVLSIAYYLESIQQ